MEDIFSGSRKVIDEFENEIKGFNIEVTRHEMYIKSGPIENVLTAFKDLFKHQFPPMFKYTVTYLHNDDETTVSFETPELRDEEAVKTAAKLVLIEYDIQNWEFLKYEVEELKYSD